MDELEQATNKQKIEKTIQLIKLKLYLIKNLNYAG